MPGSVNSRDRPDKTKLSQLWSARRTRRATFACVLDPRTIQRLAKLYGGLPLLGCLPGSPAARAGLRWGDIVIAINGAPTPDVDSYVEAKGLREGGMTVVIARDGTELHIELDYADWEPATVEDAVHELERLRLKPTES
jgi:membrane-associated protease RseP (regulator of RpoE activity)